MNPIETHDQTGILIEKITTMASGQRMTIMAENNRLKAKIGATVLHDEREAVQELFNNLLKSRS